MTLVSAAANMTGTLMQGDRRLSADGKPVPLEVTKVGCVFWDDARALVGFSGLAELHGIGSMHQWLPEAIGRVVGNEPTIEPSLVSVAEELSRVYAGQPAAFRSIALSVLFCGYQYRQGSAGQESRVISRTLSGPDPSGAFCITDHLATARPSSAYYAAIGQTQSLASADVEGFAQLVLENKPWRAQAAKLAEVMVAARSTVSDVVGGDFSILYLPRELAKPVEADYYSSVVTSERFYGFYVDPTTVMTDWSVDVQSSKTGPTLNLAVPRVGRNAPCPCGIGEKYKRCHGR